MQNTQLSEEQEAIRRTLAGDRLAFSSLQNKYQRQIASLIRKMIRNEDDAADLVQETFIKAFTALHSYQSEYPFSAWLYRIASNNCIDFLRKKRLQAFSIDKPVSSDDGEYTYEIPDDSYMPDTHVLSSEKKLLIEQAMNALPEKYQRIIRMRHEEEMDYQQIADELDLPLGTVKAHLFRARRQLFKMLSQHTIHFEE